MNLSFTINESELNNLIVQILLLKSSVASLHKRLWLIRHGYALKTEFEKNEIDIIVYDTNILIIKRNKIIFEKEQLLTQILNNNV